MDGNFDLRPWFGENRWPLLIGLAALILVSYMVFPLLDGVVLGMVFAYVGRPIRNLFGHRRRMGSLVATFCIVIPISLVVGLGMIEIANEVVWLAEHQGDILAMASDFIGGIEIPQVIFDALRGSIQNLLGIVTSIVTGIPYFDLGKGISLGIINFVLSLPVCYFLLLDGYKLVESIISILLPERMDLHRKYFARIDWILSGIFLGSLYTAIVGGVISAVVFNFFGVPRPFAMASFVFLAGLVPILTSWMVIIPLTVFRYYSLGPAEALLFFVVASALIYLPSELAIRPYLVATRSSIHPLLVMISFLGGALVAGIGGFFLTPALVGVLVGIYQVRREELILARDLSLEEKESL
jgi:predicted PurR-regulated permease PerM